MFATFALSIVVALAPAAKAQEVNRHSPKAAAVQTYSPKAAEANTHSPKAGAQTAHSPKAGEKAVVVAKAGENTAAQGPLDLTVRQVFTGGWNVMKTAGAAFMRGWRQQTPVNRMQQRGPHGTQSRAYGVPGATVVTTCTGCSK